jgi:putative membrane-bound dehydrogenase-like protein
LKTRLFTLLSACALAAPAQPIAAQTLTTFSDDFENGMGAWIPSDPAKWTLTATPTSKVLHLLGKSDYQPPHRSPHSIALLRDAVWGDFTLTAKVKTLQTTRGHRDMCVFFGFQDPSRFYYVHLGEQPDPHSSQIFIVNNAPRTKITTSPDSGIPWKDDAWHQVKVVRKVATGEIEIYFDDLEHPCKVARDSTFSWGAIGLGSFDDLGQWDDARIEGVKVAGKTPLLFSGAGPAAPTPLTFHKWSGKINVPDPVAISLDDQGRAYVTQTQRRQIQDLDIRKNLDWIPDDVGLRRIEDKIALFRERLAPERSAQNVARVQDLNGDGSHDYRDLTVISEKIHRVEDTDGNGEADAIQLYADGFQTEVTGIAAGILWHQGSVYATIAPDVWKLQDANGDGVSDRRTVFAHGFGHHIAYAGHDMHGLTLGPDGKIYWTIGDKGIAVTTPDGKEFSYPNEGGVLRANPDGSGFEVFAHGLRNVQELAFDEFGNLFGVDNDADMPGEKERFVCIVQGMDAGWRCSYQYRGKDYNPWTAEKLWQPRQEGQPAYFVPPLSNSVDGPCGFTYNPGTALDAGWQRTFFLTEAPGGKQWAFQVEPDGPAFRMVNARQIGAGIAIVGWKFGPDGALYGADWGSTAYSLDQTGGIWSIDVPGGPSSPERQKTKQALAADVAKMPVSALAEMLGAPDQRVRLKAQFELVARGATETLQTALTSTTRLARVHAIWGLGQLETAEPMVNLLGDADPVIRAQAAKTLGQLPRSSPFDRGRLAERLADPDPQVQFQAAQALGNNGMPNPEVLRALLVFIDSQPDHPYFRSAQARALAAVAPIPELAAMSREESAARRMVAVLALRLLKAPEVAGFLPDASSAIRAEAACAIHDGDSIPDALPALAASLANPVDNAESFVRRAINANFRLGHAPNAERVSRYALRAETPPAMRLEALDSLLVWTNPPPLDRVDGWRRHLTERPSLAIAEALRAPVNELLDSTDQEVLEKAVQLASALKIALDPPRLNALLRNPKAPTSVRGAALDNLKTLEAARYAIETSEEALRIRGATLLATLDPGTAREHLAKVMAQSTSIPERQTALTLLGDLKAADLLKPWVERLAKGDLPAPLHLDVAEAAAKTGGLAADLPRPANDPLSPWIECLEGGDPVRGKDLFLNHIGAQCVACHKYDDSKGGSVIGPNLKAVGLRDRRYLLEALTLPQTSIAPGYGALTLTLKDGSVVSGQLKGESGGVIELRDPAQPASRKIPASQIAERGTVMSLMPPMGLMLPKRDVRDLVAYLTTLRAKSTKEKG